MLFLVRMEVRIPHDADPQRIETLKRQEKERAQELQRMGIWLQLWRVVGRYANVSVFDVESNDELHDLLERLPLYPFLDIETTPLAAHPR